MSAFVGEISSDILTRIGKTPLVRLRRLPGPGAADVLCKCEQLNPGVGGDLGMVKCSFLLVS